MGGDGGNCGGSKWGCGGVVEVRWAMAVWQQSKVAVAMAERE